jgi:hypothetical protein
MQRLENEGKATAYVLKKFPHHDIHISHLMCGEWQVQICDHHGDVIKQIKAPDREEALCTLANQLVKLPPTGSNEWGWTEDRGLYLETDLPNADLNCRVTLKPDEKGHHHWNCGIYASGTTKTLAEAKSASERAARYAWKKLVKCENVGEE